MFWRSKNHPQVWNFCDKALEFKFILVQVPGIENLAVESLFRLDLESADKLHRKLIESNPVHQIEAYIASKTTEENGDGLAMPINTSVKQLNVILTMFTRHDKETDDEYRSRQAFIKQQLKPQETAPHLTWTTSYTSL